MPVYGLYKSTTTPDYQNTKGFVSFSFLKRVKDNEAHFTLITYCKNLYVIKNFAGDDFEKATYYPEDADLLLGFETNVRHHEVFAQT